MLRDTKFRDMLFEASEIIKTYKEDNKITDPLDGDETKLLSQVFLVYLDFNEGNITRSEMIDKIMELEEKGDLLQ